MRIVKDLDLDLPGATCCSSRTSSTPGSPSPYLRKTLAARGAASLEVCALMVREATLRVDLATCATSASASRDDWVVGYGLDVAAAVPQPARHPGAGAADHDGAG